MMIRMLLAVLLGIVVTGCASYWKGQTEGTSGPIAWYISDAKSEANTREERYEYFFVLVLQETQGTPLTFTTISTTRYSGTGGVSPGVDERTVQGTWKFQANGTRRFTYTYSVTCPEGSGCMKLGPLAPTYHIVLTGTDSQEKPVQVIIDAKLPPNPDAIPKH